MTAGMGGRILEPMVRRIAGLVLALLVAGAPAALTACELLCASHDVQPAHACHESQPAGTTSVTGGLDVCGHGDVLPEAAGALTPQSPPVSTLAVIVLPQPAHTQRVPLSVLAVAPFRSDPLTLKTQLRI